MKGKSQREIMPNPWWRNKSFRTNQRTWVAWKMKLKLLSLNMLDPPISGDKTNHHWNLLSHLQRPLKQINIKITLIKTKLSFLPSNILFSSLLPASFPRQMGINRLTALWNLYWSSDANHPQKRTGTTYPRDWNSPLHLRWNRWSIPPK